MTHSDNNMAPIIEVYQLSDVVSYARASCKQAKMTTFTKFMDLPLVLRLTIYDTVLVSDEPISFGNKSALLHPPMTSPAITNHLGKYFPLTQVSRQIRDETTPILYGQNTFDVVLRSVKTRVIPPPQPNRSNRKSKTGIPLYDRSLTHNEVSLAYGDHHAATWALIARPDAIARLQRLSITIEKADLNTQWKHYRQLTLSSSSLSLERTGVFSARRWHLHAIELKCPGLDTTVWTLDCRENRTGDRRLKWHITGSGCQGETQACSRCRLLLDDWRIDRVRQGGMSKELFLAMAWYVSAVMEALLQ